ncbi:MAG: ubiquinol-cytochrome c reductase iron-sulfur subunit [Thalassobaculaceae bacterium]|nr:ubiquinol-cytochrome c reductase iron-sulfur subunit [Thalassobaculaceae bacterium]
MAETHEGDSRRDFLIISTTAVGAVGAACVAWPFIDQMNPAADTLALASIEFDVSTVAEGQSVTLTWRGKPVFVRHRTPKEIEEAQEVPLDDLRDPQADSDRVIKPEYLVLVGVCTHLGCVPLGQKVSDPRGDYDGWFCPCHGSHYDSSGRIRRGPAPLNLAVPSYEYISDTVVRIG